MDRELLWHGFAVSKSLSTVSKSLSIVSKSLSTKTKHSFCLFNKGLNNAEKLYLHHYMGQLIHSAF